MPLIPSPSPLERNALLSPGLSSVSCIDRGGHGPCPAHLCILCGQHRAWFTLGALHMPFRPSRAHYITATIMSLGPL